MAFLNPVELLFDETHADVHFECEDNGETISIPAHKIVLRACSTVFHSAITLTTFGKRNDQEEPLPVPAGISLRSFKIFLSWMYTGQLRHAFKGDESVTTEEDFETSLADCLGVLYLANMHEMTGLASLILKRIPDTIRGDYEIAKVILDRGYLIAQVEETPENKLDRKRWLSFWGEMNSASASTSCTSFSFVGLVADILKDPRELWSVLVSETTISI